LHSLIILQCRLVKEYGLLKFRDFLKKLNDSRIPSVEVTVEITLNQGTKLEIVAFPCLQAEQARISRALFWYFFGQINNAALAVQKSTNFKLISKIA
jgi:hypothetical protein